MKYFLALLCSVLISVGVYGQRQNKYSNTPRREIDEVNAVVTCLQTKDTASYFSLFPPFDTLWRMVMHNPDHTPEMQKQLAVLKEHPQSLLEFDPMYNHDIINRFCAVLAKGEDSGIMWRSVVLRRYELENDHSDRNLEGYDKIAPERFKGYIFLKDMLTRRTFCVTITEIQKLKGYYFGGQVLNILEASNIDEYIKKEAREHQYYEWLAQHPDSLARLDSIKAVYDSLKWINAEEDEGDENKKRLEVIDRKYYEGKFDNEIPVKLYVRYMKGFRSKSAMYDGLYKFGDQKKYIKLEIKIGHDGKWVMQDEAPLGIMELTLKGDTYTGTWTNNDENGYDAVLHIAPAPEKKIEAFDRILDQGASGKVNEEVFELPQKKEKGSKKDKDDDDQDKPDKKERHRSKKEKKAQQKSDDDDDDEEWQRGQERAKAKERKQMRKLYRRREDD